MKHFVAVFAVCLGVTGCGGTGDVKGTVRYKGEKLKSGTVTAAAANGSFQAQIDSEGQYEVKGLAPGKAKFFVYVPDPKLVGLVTELSNKSKESVGAGKGRVAVPVTAESKKVFSKSNMVPDKYSDQARPLLTFDVASGPNNYDISLDP